MQYDAVKVASAMTKVVEGQLREVANPVRRSPPPPRGPPRSPAEPLRSPDPSVPTLQNRVLGIYCLSHPLVPLEVPHQRQWRMRGNQSLILLLAIAQHIT